MRKRLTGLVISCAHMCDVSLGTIRTIATVQGRTKVAFVHVFFEISNWIIVVSSVVHKIAAAPVSGFFYAPGYATGNAVDIMVKRDNEEKVSKGGRVCAKTRSFFLAHRYTQGFDLWRFSRLTAHICPRDCELQTVP